MNLATIATGNLLRNRFRTVLTVAAVAVAIVTFVLLRTVVTAWSVAVDYAARDRIGTRHKVSFTMELPRRYIETVRATEGVQSATWMNWFAGRDPRNPNDFFATMAVDPESFLTVYDEVSVPADARARWLEDRQGAIVGDVLARKLGVRVGDTVRLESTIYPGEWTFRVSGIYTATRRSFDRSEFLFHWEYLNQSLPAARRDQIGWIIARVNDAGRAGDIAARIDRAFDVQDIQTVSMSERALNLSFVGMFSAVLSAINIVSMVILLILVMILGNTIAMGVRERTQEYGVLRAIGFLPRHLAAFIVGESALLGLAAGLLGLGLAYLLVQYAFGRWLEENMGGMFPYFRIEPATYVMALGFAVVLGVVAAAPPARRVAGMTVTDALRRQD